MDKDVREKARRFALLDTVVPKESPFDDVERAFFFALLSGSGLIGIGQLS